MSNQLELQMEALSELMDYSEKIIKGTEEVIKELRGTRKDDTDELFGLVIQGINWEIEVFNNCEPLINKNGQQIDKDKMAMAVGRLGKVLHEKDDIKLAACLDVDFLPFLRAMEFAALSVSQ
ncbi:MAG: molecular chaperone [Lachnospiraceae bacterium]|nr:molecular chaperone [Lachnospiraceae bacterium]